MRPPECGPDVTVVSDNEQVKKTLPGARETAATCCVLRSNTACPGSGRQSVFQLLVALLQAVVQT